jgi:uncharacterized protein (DUF58 family)
VEHLVEQALRRLQIRCRRPVEHLLAGEYRSVFKGRGMEFDELREYTAGDDVRTIDWRSLARTGRPHTRRYIEERENSFILAVDVSASAAFGSGERAKRDAAQEAAALLAWSAARNKDRVGLLLFTREAELFIPPARGRNHVLRVINELVEFRPAHKTTDLAAALDFIGRVTRKRSIVFLFSDFLCAGYEESLRLLARRHDVTALLVRDPAEQHLPAGGLVQLRDAETGRERLVDADAAAALSREPGERFAQVCREADLDHLEIGPQLDCVEALSAYFHNRRRRIIDETGG